MKRLVLFGLVLTLVLTMAVGCTTDEAKYKDGTFKADGEMDERGWTPVVEVVVENGEIVSVDYDEYNEAGELKSEDDEYAESMKSVSGVSPAEAYKQLEDALVKRQDVDQVDAVSGATTSSEQFKELVKEALNK
ncbi:MAG: FMN-binding protein [Tissierellaceae bacterium]|nr:FMN-binding protein [Tissierellaceae bacterium]